MQLKSLEFNIHTDKTLEKIPDSVFDKVASLAQIRVQRDKLINDTMWVSQRQQTGSAKQKLSDEQYQMFGLLGVSNGTQCTGLNAEKVGGNLPSTFVPVAVW